MYKCFLNCIFLVFTSCFLSACITSLKHTAEFEQGKRYFEKGYYKHAIQTLLPLACDGDPRAQYAIGYLYYYGYGVAQDTYVGYFWIKRAADQHYYLAQEALLLIKQENQLIRKWKQADKPSKSATK